MSSGRSGVSSKAWCFIFFAVYFSVLFRDPRLAFASRLRFLLCVVISRYVCSKSASIAKPLSSGKKRKWPAHSLGRRVAALLSSRTRGMGIDSAILINTFYYLLVREAWVKIVQF